MDFSQVFEADYRCFLDQIRYTSFPPAPGASELQLRLTDSVASVIEPDETLRLTFKRELAPFPRASFEIEVTFSVILKFSKDNTEHHSEKEWSEIFSQENNPYVAIIFPRISALISHITAANGQVPLVTPPSFLGANED